jgi:hypothetical protein
MILEHALLIVVSALGSQVSAVKKKTFLTGMEMVTVALIAQAGRNGKR